jgi:energy-coupling factor transporter ATP-binding protein EcfA2
MSPLLVADRPNAVDPTEDSRIAAFRSPGAREVFHSVCQKDQIWRPYLFDVHEIHETAREAFYDALTRATTPPGTVSGQILLLLGEAGSGKTHLMRAFRNHVHGCRQGYCGYLQMTTATENYGRYVLANLIDSLDDPYFDGEINHSSLQSLSNALVDVPGLLPPGEIEQLRTAELSLPDLGELTNGLADRFIGRREFANLDADLIRALCYLQRDDSRIKSRVLKFLRCENLNEYDRRYVPGLEPRLHDHHPQEMVERLGQLMWAVEGRSLVLLIDQLEDMANFDADRSVAEVRFRRAIQTLCALAGAVPSSVFVISCLEDFYKHLREMLVGPARDRLEQDPAPVRISATRTQQEVEEIVKSRLKELYEAAGVETDDPLFPFPADFLRTLGGMRTRDVLLHCRQFRDGFGRERGAAPSVSAPVVSELAQKWNDFQAGFECAVPDSDDDQAQILADAIIACGAELAACPEMTIERQGRKIHVTLGADHAPGARLLVAICNNAARGGHLARQLEELQREAGELTPAIVRSTEFPSGPTTKIANLLGKFLAQGGRRTVVEDSHWRQMLAFHAFHEQNHTHPHYAAWRQADRPLAGLKPLIDLLQLDRIPAGPATNKAATPVPVPVPPPAARRPADNAPAPAPLPPAEPLPAAAPQISVGVTTDLREARVEFERNEFTRHVAFLGGSGSGKTTVALNLIEQLAAMRIPSILIDRKGDLCGYAGRHWQAPRPDDPADLAARRQRLQSLLDVRIYTPGSTLGNPLSIPLVPQDCQSLPAAERDSAAKVAAAALGGMLEFNNSGRDKKLHAILYQAILLLSQTASIPPTVGALADFIGNEDPALTNATGWIDTRLFRKLAESLQALLLLRGNLFAADAVPLEIDRLFGRGQPPSGRTALSIVSTKFLGDTPAIEFWVAQFLAAVERWISRNPADHLQGVLLFDEADIYLPANRQPATKLPLENLLKRARSAGLGIFLSTQSPGDMDYKCRENIRSWFLGRIHQDTALKKLKPLFGARGEQVSRLGGHAAGQFTLIRDGQPQSLRADRSVLEAQQWTEDEILQSAKAGRAG